MRSCAKFMAHVTPTRHESRVAATLFKLRVWRECGAISRLLLHHDHLKYLTLRHWLFVSQPALLQIINMLLFLPLWFSACSFLALLAAKGDIMAFALFAGTVLDNKEVISHFFGSIALWKLGGDVDLQDASCRFVPDLPFATFSLSTLPPDENGTQSVAVDFPGISTSDSLSTLPLDENGTQSFVMDFPGIPTSDSMALIQEDISTPMVKLDQNLVPTPTTKVPSKTCGTSTMEDIITIVVASAPFLDHLLVTSIIELNRRYPVPPHFVHDRIVYWWGCCVFSILKISWNIFVFGISIAARFYLGISSQSPRGI